MDSIGERIEKLMRESEYTQKELADMAGISESAISRYIKGERIPKSKTIANLATALNTTSDYLINGRTSNNDFDEIYRIVARSSSDMTQDEKMKLMRLLTKE